MSPHPSYSVFAEVIGNHSKSTLSLFGILLLCRDDIAYLSEDQFAAGEGLLTQPAPSYDGAKRFYVDQNKLCREGKLA